MVKRIKVVPEKLVPVSAEVETKVARSAAAVGFSREEAERIAAAEPRGATVYADPYKPSRPRSSAGSQKSRRHRSLGRAQVVRKVHEILAESNSEVVAFDVNEWVDRWLELRLAQLGGKKPSEIMDTQEGFAALETILERMWGGTVG